MMYRRIEGLHSNQDKLQATTWIYEFSKNDGSLSFVLETKYQYRNRVLYIP